MFDFQRRVTGEIPALRRYARALTRDAGRAEDLLQDCLERALSRRHLFRRPAKLRPWLFRIMHNVHANQARAASRRPESRALEQGEDPRTPADQISRVEIAETIAAFDRLADEQRTALLLVAVEGLTYGEAAAILGVPHGTVMSRVARARERLRAQLQDAPRPHLRRVK